MARWTASDLLDLCVVVSVHVGAAAAPLHATPAAVAAFVVAYFVTGCLGITCCYHRLLCHRSYRVPLPLEYLFAVFGVLAVQGDPIEWVSVHRHHHTHSDVVGDPHSPRDGFWWAHVGWVFSQYPPQSNVSDLHRSAFYRFLARANVPIVIGSAAITYAAGGLAVFLWAFCFRVAFVWNCTWLVNSACHVTGSRPYQTSDNSRNTWWVALLAWGEGWHASHHAFPSSARHGMEWWQLDVTWCVISAMRAIGLAWSVRLPTEAEKHARHFSGTRERPRDLVAVSRRRDDYKSCKLGL